MMGGLHLSGDISCKILKGIYLDHFHLSTYANRNNALSTISLEGLSTHKETAALEPLSKQKGDSSIML